MIAVSMDGKGRALDNIFIERLWRSVKYEGVYIKGYRTIPEAEDGLAAYPSPNSPTDSAEEAYFYDRSMRNGATSGDEFSSNSLAAQCPE